MKKNDNLKIIMDIIKKEEEEGIYGEDFFLDSQMNTNPYGNKRSEKYD